MVGIWAVGTQSDTFELMTNYAGQHAAQMLISKPHGMNISRINNRVVFSIIVFAIPYSRVKCIGEAAFERPTQFGIGRHSFDTASETNIRSDSIGQLDTV